MSVFFWLATIVMSVVAFSFVASPLRQAQRRSLMIALGLAVPIVSASMYLFFGSPNVASATSSVMATSSPSSAVKDKKVGSVSSMLEGLEQRLQDNPGDGKGWLLLAKSYKHTNRPVEAREAYAKAKALGEFDATLEETPMQDATPVISGPQIAGNLSLSAKAAKLVEPTDSVFIFARGAGGAGVPAAVLRLSASDLPLNFTLNDTQAMTPSIKLSDFTEVVVTARISRSGNAMEALQGLEAKSDIVTVASSKPLNLIIE